MLPNPDAPHDLTNPRGIQDLLLFRMSKIVSLAGGIVTRLCEGRFGITRREWTVLAVLQSLHDAAWNDLASRCELDDPRLSRAVSSLVAKGLAVKSLGASRQLRVSLSDKGRDLYAEIFPLTRQVNAELIDGLDDEAVSALNHVLDVLHDRAQALTKQTALPKAQRRARHRP